MYKPCPKNSVKLSCAVLVLGGYRYLEDSHDLSWPCLGSHDIFFSLIFFKSVGNVVYCEGTLSNKTKIHYKTMLIKRISYNVLIKSYR